MYQSIPKLEMKGWGPSLIHALGYNTTLFAGQSEGSYVLILVPKKLEDLETFNAVLQRGARGNLVVKVGTAIGPTGRHTGRCAFFMAFSMRLINEYLSYILKTHLGNQRTTML